MENDRNQQEEVVNSPDPRQLLPGEDLRQHLERLYKLGLLKFEPGCPRCHDHGCIACFP